MPSERQRNEKTDAIGTTAESDRLKRNARSDKMEYAPISETIDSGQPYCQTRGNRKKDQISMEKREKAWKY